MRKLKLTLRKIPFVLMSFGAKQDEFRQPSKWIKSRLVGKDYTHVEFTHGYGADKPWFMAEYKGYSIAEIKETRTFTYGDITLTVFVEPGDYIIHLDKVTDFGLNKAK